MRVPAGEGGVTKRYRSVLFSLLHTHVNLREVIKISQISCCRGRVTENDASGLPETRITNTNHQTPITKHQMPNMEHQTRPPTPGSLSLSLCTSAEQHGAPGRGGTGGSGEANSHGARPFYQAISMIQWREAGPPDHLDDRAVVNQEVSLSGEAHVDHPRPFKPSIKSQFFEILTTFGDKCPQNGSKNEQTAPRTNTGYPHIGPFVVWRKRARYER